jgi:hypothetical protein
MQHSPQDHNNNSFCLCIDSYLYYAIQIGPILTVNRAKNMFRIFVTVASLFLKDKLV